MPPQSHIYIVTQRNLIHHTDSEGRYSIISVFGSEKAANKRAKQQAKDEAARTGGEMEKSDYEDGGWTIRPRWEEGFEWNVVVERHLFEDGAEVRGGDDDDDDDGDGDSGSDGEGGENWDSDEVYDVSIEWNPGRGRMRKLWSDSEDEPDEDEEEDLEDLLNREAELALQHVREGGLTKNREPEPEKHEEDEDDLVVLNPKSSTTRQDVDYGLNNLANAEADSPRQQLDVGSQQKKKRGVDEYLENLGEGDDPVSKRARY